MDKPPSYYARYLSVHVTYQQSKSNVLLPTPRGHYVNNATRSSSSSCSSPFSVTDKVIIVAGSGSKFQNQWGIGSATSILLSNLGANVISVSRSIESGRCMADQFRKDGVHDKCWIAAADCLDMESVQILVDKVMNRHGRIDVLINAGIHLAKTNGFDSMCKDKWVHCLNANVNAQYNLTKATIPIFTTQKSGNIIFFSTIAARLALGMKRQRHGYAAGKAASTELTKRLGIEYARDGIRANVLNIGYTSGALVSRAVHHSNADEEAVRNKRDSCVPRGKQGTPEEVAAVSAFLASDASSFKMQQKYTVMVEHIP